MGSEQNKMYFFFKASFVNPANKICNLTCPKDYLKKVNKDLWGLQLLTKLQNFDQTVV